MKPKSINWQEHKECTDVCGYIGKDEIFTIKERTLKNKTKVYVLISSNVPNEAFHRSTQLKEINQYDTLEDAKKAADGFWNNYIYQLIED